MSEKEEDYFNYAMFHNISDFPDLSISDIITLQFLVRYSDPVVRHTLFNEVKQFIEFQEKSPFKNSDFYNNLIEKKKLTTGKFYHSLDKLEKKGLLTFDGEVGKLSVLTTKFTNYVPKLLLKFLINNDIMNSQDYRDEFSQKFLKKIGNRKFERILTIWLSEYVPYSIAEQISKYCKESYILAKTEITEAKNKENGNGFKYSEVIDRMFRDREDFFDGTIIPVYKKNPKFHEMSNTMILKEISRVTKSEGVIILIAVADIKETGNIFIDELINVYKSALINRIATKEELEAHFKSAEIDVIDISEQQGLLIGIGRNKSK